MQRQSILNLIVTVLQNVAWVECMDNSAKLARNFEETGISSAPHASCETRNQIVAAGFNAALAVDDNIWREGLYRSADSPQDISAGPLVYMSARA